MPRPTPPSADEEKQIMAMLSAAMKAPRPPSVPFNEKLSIAEHFRRWSVAILLSLMTIGAVAFEAARLREQVKENTERGQEDHRKTAIMWWMKENGYTNKDVEPVGPIKTPDFE